MIGWYLTTSVCQLRILLGLPPVRAKSAEGRDTKKVLVHEQFINPGTPTAAQD